jgi:hypothetical protein
MDDRNPDDDVAVLTEVDVAGAICRAELARLDARAACDAAAEARKIAAALRAKHQK